MLHRLFKYRISISFLYAIFACTSSLVATAVWATEGSRLVVASGHMKGMDFEHTKLTTSHQSTVLALVNEGLLTLDEDGRVIPGLAESWTVSEDGRSYTFILRENLSWSDGKSITAADFVAGWRKVASPGNNISHFLGPIKNSRAIFGGEMPQESLGVEALDERTLQVQLETPTAYFEVLLSAHHLAPVPSHLTEEELKKAYITGVDALSSGPYVVSASTEEEVVLEKNNRYWGVDKTEFDSIVFSMKLSGNESIKSVVSGKADIALSYNESELSWVRKSYPHYVREFPGVATEYYRINLDNKDLGASRELRQALSMSIDRSRISNKLAKGNVSPAYTFAPASLYKFEKNTVPDWYSLPPEHRLGEAKKIMARLGFTKDTPLKVELATRSFESEIRIAKYIGATWRKIGVDVEIVERSTKELYAALKTGEYEVSRAGWRASYPDPYNFLSLVGSNQKLFSGNKPLKEVDELLSKSMSSVDLEQRERIYIDIERTLHDYVPLIPIYHYKGFQIVSPEIEMLERKGHNYLRWLKKK